MRYLYYSFGVANGELQMSQNFILKKSSKCVGNVINIDFNHFNSLTHIR
jgi:hypothetical protein